MTFSNASPMTDKPCVVVLATTYPRWPNDHEPAFVHSLCQRLRDRFEVVVICPDAPGADPSGSLDGVDVVRYRYAPRHLQTLVNDGGIASNLRRSVWKWALVPSFVVMHFVAARRILRSRPVAIVHAHWLISPGVVARLLCGVRVPYVITSHGGDLFGFRGILFTWAKRWVAARARAMTVVSRAMADEVGRLGLPVREVDVIPMGVDMVGRFALDETVRRSTDTMLFVGRLVEKKGLRHLLEAMPLVIAARPTTRLRIVGFGPERGVLEARVAELGLSGHITFDGAIEQQGLPAMYGRAAMFVAPFVRDKSGDQEGLPVALMEAIAMGCPFVVGDVAGLDDLLGEVASDYRVDPSDHEALAGAMLRVLNDPDTARRAALQARERVRSTVEWGAVTRQYTDVLQAAMTPGEP